MNPATIHRTGISVRADAARAAMSRCRLCIRDCGTDRTAGPAGACRSDAVSRVFQEGIEWAGEAGIVPTYIVGLSGCNMACRFCIAGAASQDALAGSPLDPDAVAERIRQASPHLKSVMILGGEPTLHLDGALEIAARVPQDIQLVWKTNATLSAESRSLLEGVPDLVLADYKFGNDRCAETLAGIPGYTRAVQETFRWAARGSKLIIRHLLMPGHLDCCFDPVVRWLARELPQIPISLMAGYLPTHLAANDPVLGRMNRPDETARAKARAADLGIRTVPWKFDPAEGIRPGGTDVIWIDRNGRVCVDMASAELIPVLKRISPDIV